MPAMLSPAPSASPTPHRHPIAGSRRRGLEPHQSPEPAGSVRRARAVAPLAFADAKSLSGSLRGIDVLFNTYWFRVPQAGETHDDAVRNLGVLFAAARRAGVRRIVHISVANPDAQSPYSYHRCKAQAEEALAASGVGTPCSVRPSCSATSRSSSIPSPGCSVAFRCSPSPATAAIRSSRSRSTMSPTSHWRFRARRERGVGCRRAGDDVVCSVHSRRPQRRRLTRARRPRPGSPGAARRARAWARHEHHAPHRRRARRYDCRPAGKP